MSEVTKPIALDESLNTTESTPRNIADVLADELVISDLVTQAQAIVTKLQGIISAVKPDASDIPLAPITGMVADDVQEGISELKGTLDDVIATLITHSATQYLIGTLKFKGSYNDATVRLQIGKLDNNTNYVQFFVNDVDYGYIRFDVSRNIGVIN